MTNTKLVKCHNLPWRMGEDRPPEMHIWVPQDWVYEEKVKEFNHLLHKEKSIDCGFADWLLTQGATDAVTEDWTKTE